MSVIDDLIYDRTQADITNKTDKAYISYLDLNRIESAVSYISNLLNTYSYTNITNNKTDWNMRDIRFQIECDRIRNNYIAIKNAFTVKADTPLIPNNFNWETIEQANAIEKILYDINELIEQMTAGFRASGTFNCGEMEGLI